MKISTLVYSFYQGLVNIKRNKMFSLASAGTIAACIFLLGTFYSVVANFQYMVKEMEKTISITVFFDKDLEEEQIVEIGEKIKQRYGVREVKYTSGEEAWEAYKEKYFADSPELAEGFKEDNPLANSSSYEIFLNDISMQPAMVTFLENLDGIRKVNYSDSTATAMTDLGKMVGFISAAIILILLGVGIFLISNTVTIGISVRKEEIAIMKLIGATDTFVRAPFLIEGIVIGIIGAMVPLTAIYYIYDKAIGYVMGQFQGVTSQLTFLSTHTIFQVLVPMSVLIGGGIGLVGSNITLRKHLKV